MFEKIRLCAQLYTAVKTSARVLSEGLKFINNLWLKNKKNLPPWKRFWYPVLICTDFGDFVPSFSPHLTISLRIYIKHSKQCFIRYLNTLTWVKKNLCCASFFNPLRHFQTPRNLWKDQAEAERRLRGVGNLKKHSFHRSCGIMYCFLLCTYMLAINLVLITLPITIPWFAWHL